MGGINTVHLNYSIHSNMTEEKKSKNPFINAANAAKTAAANPKVPGTKTAQVQAAKFGNQVPGSKPTKRSAGRGR